MAFYVDGCWRCCFPLCVQKKWLSVKIRVCPASLLHRVRQEDLCPLTLLHTWSSAIAWLPHFQAIMRDPVDGIVSPVECAVDSYLDFLRHFAPPLVSHQVVDYLLDYWASFVYTLSVRCVSDPTIAYSITATDDALADLCFLPSKSLIPSPNYNIVDWKAVHTG